MLVLGGQEWPYSQFNREMEMSRQGRRPRHVQVAPGLARSTGHHVHQASSSTAHAGLGVCRSPACAAGPTGYPRGPGTSPQQNRPLLGQELQAGWQEVVLLLGQREAPAREMLPIQQGLAVSASTGHLQWEQPQPT